MHNKSYDNIINDLRKIIELQFSDKPVFCRHFCWINDFQKKMKERKLQII